MRKGNVTAPGGGDGLVVWLARVFAEHGERVAADHGTAADADIGVLLDLAFPGPALDLLAGVGPHPVAGKAAADVPPLGEIDVGPLMVMSWLVKKSRASPSLMP